MVLELEMSVLRIVYLHFYRTSLQQIGVPRVQIKLQRDWHTIFGFGHVDIELTTYLIYVENGGQWLTTYLILSTYFLNDPLIEKCFAHQIQS